MLGNKDAAANIAVRNMKIARKFYEGTLGLKAIGTQGEELVAYRSGSSTILVYRSDFAGTNKATGLTWTVGDDVETIARSLKAKGVTFEHYDLPGMTLKGDVHVASAMKIAWFTDPDGNILSIASG
ncbi:MAG TPA: VOC family protein [Burkholderiales bacterium]|nr:VOC family protein [Burkholderiales bacterium]